MAQIDLLTSEDLAGSGASAEHAPALLAKINELVAAWNSIEAFSERIEVDEGTGDMTVYFDTAKTTYITFNSAENRYEYYINNTLEGTWDVVGPGAEPGE